MQKNTANKPAAAKQGAEALPNVPLGLMPVYMWWQANGRQVVTNAAIVVIVAGVVFGAAQWRRQRVEGANREFLQAQSFEELSDFVGKYGSMKIAKAARLRLAAAYFDAGRYEDALDAYDACLKKGAPVGFAEVAQMGRAHSLEAVGSLDEAAAAYTDFEKANAQHFLAAQARMGLARVLTLQGKKDEAKLLLETLKAERTGEPMVEMAIAQLEGVVNRYEPRAARSLFDRADEAAKSLEALDVSVPLAPDGEAEEP
ncbi:MAG: hypothetical protein FWG50_03555 [Kiritimatiellaeota bacterium]|nr:hypothetical protein [Kiritimatiellota bacterium]